MAFIDIENYSNKKLTLYFVIFGLMMGGILFLIPVKPVLVLLGIGILLCFMYLKNVWFWFIIFMSSLPFNNFLAIDIGVPIRLSYFLFPLLFLSILYNIYGELKLEEIEKKTILNRFKTPFDKEIIIFLFIIAVSIFQSQYILPNSPVTGDTFFNYPWIKSITKALLIGVLLTMFYTTVFMITTKEKLKRALFWYILFVFLYSLYGIISYVFFVSGYHVNILGFEPVIQHDPSSGTPRIRSVAEEPLFFGFYIMMVIFIMFRLWFDCRINLHKESHHLERHQSLLFGAIVSTILALILTFSRSAWIGFFAGIGCLLVFLCKDIGTKKLVAIFSMMYRFLFQTTKKRRRASFLVCFFLIALLSYFIYFQLIDAFSGSRFWSTKTRLITYEQAFSAFLLHPFLGIGYENFNFYSGTKYYPGLVEFNFNWTEVNNYPLKILTELGIIGFIAAAFLYFKVFILTLKSIKEARDPFLLAVLVSSFATLIATSVILLFSSSIIMPYLWISAGIHVAAIKINDMEKNHIHTNHININPLKINPIEAGVGSK